MEPTLREKAESRVAALKLMLATADAKLEEAHKTFKLQQGAAYSLAARLRDAERLALSFVGTAQETPTGQAAADLSLAQAKSNVVEYGPAQSIEKAGRDLLDSEERQREYDARVAEGRLLCEATSPETIKDLTVAAYGECNHAITLSHTAGDPYTECMNCKAFKMERTGVWQNSRARGMEST